MHVNMDPQRVYNKGKCFCKTSFQAGMHLKKYRNKAEMKESKQITLSTSAVYLK